MLLMEVPVRGPVRSGRLDTSLDRAVEADYLGCLLHRLPSLPARGRVAGFSHMYTVNHDDVHPVVGPSALPGLHLCNGFSGHGFKLAPAVGSLVARQLDGAARAPAGCATDGWDTTAPAGFLSAARAPLCLGVKSHFA